MDWLVKRVKRLSAERKTGFLEKVTEEARVSENAFAYAFCINELNSLGIDAQANPKYSRELYEEGALDFEEYVAEAKQSLEADSKRNFLRYSAFVRQTNEIGIDVNNLYTNGKLKAKILARTLGTKELPTEDGEKKLLKTLNYENSEELRWLGSAFKSLYSFAKKVVRNQ